MATTQNIKKHHRTTLSKCKGALYHTDKDFMVISIKERQIIFSEDYVYWCPNHNRWYIQKCSCKDAYWNKSKK